MHWHKVVGLVALQLFAVGSADAHMGGLGLYELGTNGTGNAHAGMAADASDASIAYFNPAAMTALKGVHNFAVGLVGIYGDLTFQPGSETTGTGGDGGNALGFLPSVGLYYSYAASETIRLGFAFNIPWGASYGYEPEWVGRYFVESVTLLGININPSVGFRLARWLSLGVGFQVQNFQFKQKLAFNRAPLSGDRPDGQIKIETSTWTAGVLFGASIEPTKTTRVGLTFRTPIPVDMRGEVGVSDFGDIVTEGLDGRDVDVGFTMPMGFNISARQDVLDDRLAILADFGWAQSSAFSRNILNFGNADRVIDREMQDTWRIGVGLKWRVMPKWLLQGGFAYESSPVQDGKRTPDLPIGELYRASFGTQVEVTKTVALGAHYTAGIYGNLDVDLEPLYPGSGALQGGYSPGVLHFVVATMTLRFGSTGKPASCLPCPPPAPCPEPVFAPSSMPASAPTRVPTSEPTSAPAT